MDCRQISTHKNEEMESKNDVQPRPPTSPPESLEIHSNDNHPEIGMFSRFSVHVFKRKRQLFTLMAVGVNL